MEETCKNCNKFGMVFIKNDYADRSLRTTHYYKGNVGHWRKCPYCKGTKIIKEKPNPNNYTNNVDYWNACKEYEMQRL